MHTHLLVLTCHSLLCFIVSSSALRPPVPPDFCPAFSSIVHLLCCDIVIHVLRCVLQKVTEEQTSHWTEAMVQRVKIVTSGTSFWLFLDPNAVTPFPTQALHLIGQALLEEKSQLENRSVEEVSFDFSLKACSESEFTAAISTGGLTLDDFSIKSITLFFRNWL